MGWKTEAEIDELESALDFATTRIAQLKEEKTKLDAKIARLSAPVSNEEIGNAECVLCGDRMRTDLMWVKDVNAMLAARASQQEGDGLTDEQRKEYWDGEYARINEEMLKPASSKEEQA